MKRAVLRTRWSAYAIAGVATIAAVAWASRLPAPDDTGSGAIHASTAHRAAARAAAGDRAESAPATSTRPPTPPRSAIAVVTADPFAPIGGNVQASALLAAKPASAASVAIAAPLSSLTYVGRWDEQGEQTAILDDGGQVVFAKAGETIDGYHVASISDDQVVIERLPGHEQQVLPLSGTGRWPSSAPADTPTRMDGGPTSSGSPDATD